jgi:hypothetical protein
LLLLLGLASTIYQYTRNGRERVSNSTNYDVNNLLDHVRPVAWYTITSLQQGTNDLVRSVLCCSSLGVVCLKVAWEISRATSILLEQEVWWIYIQYLKIVWFVLALGMCAPLGYIVWKDWQKFKEARESWKQHQRLSQAESGAEEKSN